MAIPYLSIADAVRAKLDAEGSSYYRDDLDIIPALNLCQDNILTTINSKLGAKKFAEEFYRGLIKNRIYQSSIYARVQIDQPTLSPAIQVWSILSVVVSPQIVTPTSTTPATFTPTGNPYSSLTNYVYFNGGTACKRLNSQERYSNQNNPMEAGWAGDPANPNPQNISYAYLSHTDYESFLNPNVIYEIEIIPKNVNTISAPIGVTFVNYPTRIVNTTDILDWHPVAQEILVEGTLWNIAWKQGDKSTVWQLSEQQLSELLSSMIA